MINLPDYGAGQVKFAGLAAFNPGIWYGIELESTPKKLQQFQNKGDGTVSGIKYFECSSRNGIFRRKEDLYAQLAGLDNRTKPDIVIQRNIKPSIYNSKTHSNKINRPGTTKGDNKANKKFVSPTMVKATSAPYPSMRDKRIPLTDVQSLMPDTSNSTEGDIVEIKDNDHSQDTKEEEYDFYDEDIKPTLNIIDASDDIYADDEDEYIDNNNRDKHHKNRPKSKSTPRDKSNSSHQV